MYMCTEQHYEYTKIKIAQKDIYKFGLICFNRMCFRRSLSDPNKLELKPTFLILSEHTFVRVIDLNKTEEKCHILKEIQIISKAYMRHFPSTLAPIHARDQCSGQLILAALATQDSTTSNTVFDHWKQTLWMNVLLATLPARHTSRISVNKVAANCYCSPVLDTQNNMAN